MVSTLEREGVTPAFLEPTLSGPILSGTRKRSHCQLPGQSDDHLPKGELVQEAVHQDRPLHPEGQHAEVEGHAAPAVSPQRRGEEAQAEGRHDGDILEQG